MLLALVVNLAYRWRHLHWYKFQVWSSVGATCIAALPWIVLLTSSVGIDFLSFLARIKKVFYSVRDNRTHRSDPRDKKNGVKSSNLWPNSGDGFLLVFGYHRNQIPRFPLFLIMPLDIFSKADICHDRRHLCNEHSWQEIAVGFVGSVNLVSLLLVLQPLLWRLCEKDLRKCGSTSMTLINL